MRPTCPVSPDAGTVFHADARPAPFGGRRIYNSL